MNKLKLSIIVPFYNVEKYIAKCLDSLLDQDIPELEYEIICVNDCSPDNSRNIVIEYQKNHPNIILIEHESNKRQGAARNTGLSKTRGQFVWFVDSDDWIMSNCLKDILSICEKGFLDILAFNFLRVENQENIVKKGNTFKNSVNIMDGCNYIHLYFGEDFVNYLLGYPWMYLYKTIFLKKHNLFFPEDVFFEDTLFPFKALVLADKVQSIDRYLYYYRLTNGSITNTYDMKLKGDLIFQYSFIAGESLFKFSEEMTSKDNELASILNEKAIWYYNSFVRRIIVAPIKEKKVFYKLLSKNKEFVKDKIAKTTWKARILSMPNIGLFFAIIIKPVYLLKKKLEK